MERSANNNIVGVYCPLLTQLLGTFTTVERNGSICQRKLNFVNTLLLGREQECDAFTKIRSLCCEAVRLGGLVNNVAMTTTSYTGFFGNRKL